MVRNKFFFPLIKLVESCSSNKFDIKIIHVNKTHHKNLQIK